MIRESRVIRAIELNPESLWRHVASHSRDAIFHESHGYAAVSFPIGHALFNTVLRAHLSDGNAEESIRDARAFYAARQKPWTWIVGPSSLPADLAAILEARGFVRSHETPGMALDLHGYEPRDAGAAEVRDLNGLRTWIDVVLRGFGLPAEAGKPFYELHERAGFDHSPARYFYVEEEGTPVACSMNFNGAGVTGIYCVATLPEARRRGYGERAMHASLAAAVEDGFDVAILHSSRMGLPLYERLGFREFCKLAYFLPGDPIS